MTRLIQIEKLTKNYHRGSEEVHALRGVSMNADSGEFIAIVGPSGSGKTTLLQQIGCMDHPTGGAIQINGTDTTKLKASHLDAFRARTIGFVFQRFYLVPTLTALENVELPLLFGPKGESNKAEELLESVGLGERLHHRPAHLSGGEMQRVAIARSLVNKPRILLADEPTGNLDSENANAILDLFSSLNADGMTVLMVTHNTELAARAHRVLHLKDGSIYAPSEMSL